MSRTIFIIALLLMNLTVFAQEHEVELLTQKNKYSFVFSAKNHSNVQQEITLTLTTQNLNGYKKPITKLVPAKSTINVVTLNFIKGKANKYSSKYTYRPKPNQEELALQKKRLDEKRMESVGDLTKGIVVFSKDGCSRCHYTTSYMLDNNIDFKLLNTTENKDYNKIMWDLLKKKII